MINFAHKPLSLAIVGLSFGNRMLGMRQQASLNSYFELVWLCDLKQSLSREVAAQRNVRSYASLQELIRDPSIAVVGLFTSPTGRAALLDQILDAGKDVLTTKPFELDSEEAERVLRKAKRLGRVIYVNSPSPELTSDMAQVKAWTNEFELGRLVSARGETWAPYFEEADGSWMDDPWACPGGAMMRIGIYLLNDILELTGAVEDVKFTGTRVRTGRSTPDNALVTMRLSGGCIATVFSSFCVDDGDTYSNGLILNYEHGTIYRNIGSHRPSSAKAQPHLSPHLSLVMRTANGRETVAEATLHELSGDYQWAHLHRMITNREPITDAYIQQIVKGITVLEALRDCERDSSLLETSTPVPA